MEDGVALFFGGGAKTEEILSTFLLFKISKCHFLKGSSSIYASNKQKKSTTNCTI